MPPNAYTLQALRTLKLGLPVTLKSADDALTTLLQVCSSLTSADADMFVREGAGRRILTLKHCVANVFAGFPPDRLRVLSEAQFIHATINIQAFYMNLFGLLDCLAWVVVHEKGLLGTPISRKRTFDRRDVGLYCDETQRHLSAPLVSFLKESELKSWHDNHLKDFRDALAHRLPLYVPPFAQNLQNGEIGPALIMAQTVTLPKAVWFHQTLLKDLNIASAIVRKFCECEFSVQPLDLLKQAQANTSGSGS